MLSATILTILTTIYTAGPVTGPVVIRTCAPPPDMCGTLGDLIADAIPNSLAYEIAHALSDHVADEVSDASPDHRNVQP